MRFAKVMLLLCVGVGIVGCATTKDEKQLLRKERFERLGIEESEYLAVLNGKHSEAVASALPVLEGEYHFKQVVNIAIRNNLPLKSVLLQREEAEGTVLAARAAARPQLTLGGGVTSDLVERKDGADDYGVTLSLTQPLWRSGVISAGIRYADLYSDRIEEEIRETTQEVIEKVSKDYYGVLLAKQMVDVYSESLQVAERMLDTAQKKRKAGAVSDYEVLRAEVEVATARAAYIKEMNALRAAGIELLQDMGVDQNSRITITGALSYYPVTNDTETVILTALASRPDLMRAQADVLMAEENVRITKGQYGPSADLFATGKYWNPDPNGGKEEEWGYDVAAGISVSYKLFDGFERKGKIKQAESRLEQAKAALLAAEETARVEVTRALLAVRNADELCVSQAKNIDLSREAIRMLESGFKVGRNTQIEVLDARSALTEAIGRYYTAIYDHNVACLAVRRAAGTLYAPGNID